MFHHVVNQRQVGHRPSPRSAVGLEPRAVAGTELGEGVTVERGQQLFDWVNWRGSGHKNLVG